MDVAKNIEEFIALNNKAKTSQLTSEELERWAALKARLIADITRQPAPRPPAPRGP